MAVSRTLQDVASLTLAKCVASLAILATGFRAVSDDDYARTFIAQSFATTPRFDPSGTSWLPLPFWLTGGVMRLMGRELWVARLIAFALGIVAVLLVYAAARTAGSSKAAAWVAGVITCLLPYFGWLGVATVPEGYAAALMLLAAASTTRSQWWLRCVGGLAISAACLCRYEAWPLAAGFAALCAWDARRSPRLAVAAAIALIGPALWLTHGQVSHGDPLFFFKRVAAYRRAVGAAPEALYKRLIGFPWGVIRGEFELVLGVAALAAWTPRGVLKSVARQYGRVIGLLGLVLVALVVGDVRDGAPTHHPERAVLVVWLGMAVLAGTLTVNLIENSDRRRRLRIIATVIATTFIGALGLRPWLAKRDGFIDRSDEIALGSVAAASCPPGVIAVDTHDFAFYSIIVGVADPTRGRTIDDRDPRRQRAADPFRHSSALRRRLQDMGARCVIAERAHAAVAATTGEVTRRTHRYTLVRVE